MEAALAELKHLIDIVAQLRSPVGGCPWDLEQTPQTLIPYVIEEAYEVADALRRDDTAAIREELGDLLLQVILQAQIASESDRFTLDQVAQVIGDKLVRRHPHVFGDTEVSSPEEVRQNWEAIKAAEKDNARQPGLTPKLQRYAQTLPPLTAAMKISRKAAAVGFEWDSIDQVWETLHEELDEFRYAIQHESPERQQSEFGDILFALTQIARWHHLDPAEALHGTNDRFIQRFEKVEQVAGQSLENLSLQELEALWQKAKQQLAAQAKPDPP
jgi:XTP/dITP diphosphohydrolase